MDNCVFCKIIAGEIPSSKLFEDEEVMAFLDINPLAPIHFLVVPKEHIESAGHITPENSHLVARCFEVIALLSKQEGLTGGFRVITNSGYDGGQTVDHIHFHVLGGAKLSGPMVNI